MTFLACRFKSSCAWTRRRFSFGADLDWSALPLVVRALLGCSLSHVDRAERYEVFFSVYGDFAGKQPEAPRWNFLYHRHMLLTGNGKTWASGRRWY